MFIPPSLEYWSRRMVFGGSLTPEEQKQMDNDFRRESNFMKWTLISGCAIAVMIIILLEMLC